MNKKVLHTVIDAVSVDRGSAISISTGSRTLSYDDLRGYSNSIAHALLSTGVSHGEAVGIYLGSGIPYVCSTLGVNKCGCVFMPLELSYPEKRLVYLLEYAAPRIIITDVAGRAALLSIISGSPYMEQLEYFVLLNNEGFEIEKVRRKDEVCGTGVLYSAEAVEVEVSGEDGNYLLYTSGSTGMPKVIEGCHKGLSHFIHWEVKEFGLDGSSRVSQLVPLSFDVSLRDIFTPLLCGGTLCIPADGIKTRPVKLLEWIGQTGVTLIHTVPSLFRLLTRELESNPGLLGNLEALRYILLSGEALYNKDVAAWRRVVGSDIELVNLYGPTETTLAKIYNRISEEPGDPAAIVPLGIPLPNTSIIILDKSELCEIGAIGEIYIKTPFRSRGYYKDAALTGAAFVQNPLHSDSEDIVYRTGDLGKYLPDRTIAFVGRQDSQVKIRGNRVELSETERVMYGYPGMDQVVVMAIRKSDESDVLASYYVSSAPVDTEALRAYLREYLPDYMHPSYYLQLDEFPLNLNGKVNKKALPRPEELLYEKIAYTAPGGYLEEQLAGIWSSVLGLSRVGVNNSFFDLGGHSLTATRAVSRIYKELGVEISLKDFFEHATIRSLSEFLSSQSSVTYKSIGLLGKQDDYELSHAQKLLWVLDQSTSGMIAYNMPASCLLNGHIDKAAFHRVFETLINRHETLRTTFRVVAGEPRQQVHETINFLLEEEDASAGMAEGTTRELLINHYLEAAFSEPFNLQSGPLLRAKLVKLSADQHLFLFTMHHIISDGWSMGILVKEILELYTAYSQGLPGNLEPLRVQYKDYAAWHNRLLQGGQMQAYRNYWHNKLSGELPVLNLPVDYPRGNSRTYTGDKIRFNLSEAESDQIRQICSEQEVSLFMFFLTVINVLLYNYSGQNDILIGSPISGRNHEEIEGNVGLFLNNLVFRNKVSKNDTFNSMLQNVKQIVLEAYEYQSYPFGMLVEDLATDTGENNNPFYDVLIVVNNTGLNGNVNDWAKLEQALGVQEIDTKDGISKLDLSFFIIDGPSILMTTEYNTDLFRRSTIESINEDIISLIAEINMHKDAEIGELIWAISNDNDKVLQTSNMNELHEDF
jgi:mycobactin peptide synthetase MbtE